MIRMAPLPAKFWRKMADAISQIKDAGFQRVSTGGGNIKEDLDYTHPRLGQICVPLPD